MKKILIVVVLAAVAAALVWHFRKQPAKQREIGYRTSEISRGRVVQEVTATGTIQPIKKVDVATQVTGKVISLKADYNSHVKEGEVIALIDPDTYQSSLESAEAQLASNYAALERTRAQLVLAEKTLDRKKKLFANGGKASEAEVDAAQANYDELVATEKSNQAAIRQWNASVKTAKTNLSYCTITSPVTGVVIERAVDEGQTVVSSMNASSLYTIATDLNRIQVEAAIPEADIGGIKVGQDVNFTVDAYKRRFSGKVTQIRLASTTTSNVVTYPVIVEAENPNEMLYPGMTANLSVIVEKAEDAVMVPAAALRFTPPADAAGMGMSSGQKQPGAQRRGMRTIWIAENENAIHPVEVQIGISDGVNQALLNADELLGKNVVVGKTSLGKNIPADNNQTQNPFMPKRPQQKAPKK